MATVPDAARLSSLGRRAFLRGLAVGGCAVLLAACGQAVAPDAARSSAGSLASAKPVAWEATLDAARKEGTVSVYGVIVGGLREALIAPFEKAYPGIKVDASFIPVADLVTRLIAERQAKKYIPDVLIGPGGQAVTNIKPSGGVLPIEPVLSLPEVLDTSAWLDHELSWIDAAKPYTTLKFIAYVGTTVSYNSKLVDPKQFRSFKDLLDPKWKGKIVANDTRRGGSGLVQMRFIYRHPDLGPDFLRRLFSEMEVTMSTDTRQMTDWIGQGRYQIGLWLISTEIKAAAQQGLPVAELAGEQLVEGAPLSLGAGAVNLVESAPHPNAAAVYINWLLSKEGQTAWQDNVGQPSRRIDIPKANIDPALVPKPGAKYVDGGTEEFMNTSTTAINELITQALASAKQS